VVVDPRRTRTAEAADEWLPIRPGADGLFLAAIAHVSWWPTASPMWATTSGRT
jgi:formylmethanofuran dehydrogenase subunit B